MKKKSKKLIKEILKEVLKFRFEYFITPLFITLFILSLIYIGFNNIWNIGFNICLMIQIPLVFIGLRIARKMLYLVLIGKVNYENK